MQRSQAFVLLDVLGALAIFAALLLLVGYAEQQVATYVRLSKVCRGAVLQYYNQSGDEKVSPVVLHITGRGKDGGVLAKRRLRGQLVHGQAAMVGHELYREYRDA